MWPRRVIALGFISLGGCDAATTAAERTPTAPPPSFAKAGSSFTVTVIGPAPSIANRVNAAGQVAGQLGSPFETQRAFVWTPTTPRGSSGTLADIGTLGGAGGYATGINAAGWVVGGTIDAAGADLPFLWTAVGGMTRFDVPANAARDVNDAGQVVGLVGLRVAQWTASIASDGSLVASGYEELPALPGAGSTIAFAINELGQAAGWSVLETNHAVLWTRTSTGWIIEDLGTPLNGYASVARDVNDAGLVVGYSNPLQGCPSAVVWTTAAGRKTGMRVLPTLGGCGAEAYGVNNDGDVVGRAATSRGYWRPALWTVGPDGTASSVKDLGSPTPNVNGAGYHVSARIGGVAQVAGFLNATSGGTQATLWTVR